jgi:nitrite reductase (NADH) small subunit
MADEPCRIGTRLAAGLQPGLTPRGEGRFPARAERGCIRLADGRLCAVEDRCPQRGARLSAGVIYDGDKVACLDHGWGIRLADGGVELPEHGCVRTFRVKVEDGFVCVLIQHGE